MTYLPTFWWLSFKKKSILKIFFFWGVLDTDSYKKNFILDEGAHLYFQISQFFMTILNMFSNKTIDNPQITNKKLRWMIFFKSWPTWLIFFILFSFLYSLIWNLVWFLYYFWSYFDSKTINKRLISKNNIYKVSHLSLTWTVIYLN